MSIAQRTFAPTRPDPLEVHALDPDRLTPHPFSLEVYGNPDLEAGGLLDSIARGGILDPLIVATTAKPGHYEVLSGHRRLACARHLGLPEVPCLVRDVPDGAARRLAILDHNRQRQKSFTQRMREADALETLLSTQARQRRLANLRGQTEAPPETIPIAECRNSDTRAGRTDTRIAQSIGLGGKDLYRQARAIWRKAQDGDLRAQAAITQLDAGTKTIHAAYKDLRRRDHFTTNFTPNPYDVWSFRHDPAYGIPHPGAIPPAIIAHTVHYFSPPEGLVVDPMAGGGATLDVCQAMGRRCLAYDLHPVRPDIQPNDLEGGLPPQTLNCDLLFCDPPYHTMRAGQYPGPGVGELPLSGWIAFLQKLARVAFLQLKPGGHIALLMANQTEKGLPAGYGYLDHAFFGYSSLCAAGFLPVRRISCPMAGGYRPQQVRQARAEGRLLGVVRDLLILRKPFSDQPFGLPIGLSGGVVQGSPPARS